MGQQEPPSSTSHANSFLFFIGQNSRGNWVVQDQKHICGGLFVGRAEALRYALFENGNRPQAVIMVAGVLELDMSGTAGVVHQRPAHTDVPREQRAA
jgi:hypothetical protein